MVQNKAFSVISVSVWTSQGQLKVLIQTEIAPQKQGMLMTRSDPSVVIWSSLLVLDFVENLFLLPTCMQLAQAH